MSLRVLITSFGVIAALLLPNAVARAETPLRGPTVGILWDPAARGFRQIVGIPGSATLSSPIPVDVAAEVVEIAPSQEFALAVAAGTREVFVIRLSDRGVESRLVEAVSGLLPRGAHRIVFSPSGAYALIYGSDPGSLVTLSGLPEAAAAAAQLDLSSVPGPVTAIAIGDDGEVLAGAAGGLYLTGPGVEGARLLLGAGRISAVSFFPGSRDAVAVDSAANELHLLRGLSTTISKISLASSGLPVLNVTALAAGRDRVVAASADAVAVLHLTSGEAKVVPCHCEISGLHKLQDDSVFLLNEHGPLFLLVTGGGEPRIVFVPAVRSDAGPVTEAAPPRARSR